MKFYKTNKIKKPTFRNCFNAPPETSVAQFIVPNSEDKVNSSIGLSSRTSLFVVIVTARQQAGRALRQPHAGVNYIPLSGTVNLATVCISTDESIFQASLFTNTPERSKLLRVNDNVLITSDV
jgi:hypothetical protein